jgi:hypothetical protein
VCTLPHSVAFGGWVVDPSSYNTNPPGVFNGPVLEWVTEDTARDAEAVEAVRRFVEDHRRLPTEDSWTAAGMSPCERTVRSSSAAFARPRRLPDSACSENLRQPPDPFITVASSC